MKHASRTPHRAWQGGKPTQSLRVRHLSRLGIGVVTLFLAGGCAATAAGRAGRANTPAIAEIGGVQIGYSTQDDLERSWGEGLTTVGGHPNSGRRWRVRGTDWVIATDGFLYSDRGLVIDGLQLGPGEADPDAADAPFARLDKNAFAWLGTISCGMTRDAGIAALKRQGLAFKDEGETVSVDAEGFSEITSEENASFDHWEARLYFKEGKLSSLELAAGRGWA